MYVYVEVCYKNELRALDVCCMGNKVRFYAVLAVNITTQHTEKFENAK